MGDTIKKNFIKTKYLFCLVIILFSAFLPLKVFAVDYGFYSANDIMFFDQNACDPSSENTSGSSSGPVVAIGDSILQSAQGGNLEKSLKTKGYSDVTIDAVQSRSLASHGVGTTTGIEAIDENKDKITSAGTVLIILGTNYDGSFESNLKKAVKKIKGLNSDVRLFWANVGIKTQTSYMNKTNSILTKQKGSLGYTIIDWHKEVTNNPGYIGGDDVHPSATGAKKLVALIANSLGEAGSGGGAPIKGSDQEKNAAMVWNYLTGKGLSEKQAAGFLGNMETESGISPKAVESGGTGHGLVQWSFGRWSGSYPGGLSGWANKQGKSWQDINLQLDFLWYELNHGYKSTILGPLKKTTSVEAAAVLILLKFEIPAEKYQTGQYRQQRIDQAEKWFKKFSRYGSGTGVIDGTNCPCDQDLDPNCNPSSSSDVSAVVEWALKLAWDKRVEGISNAKPIYKEWYKKYYSGADYSACNQFVATVMRASGADSKYSLSNTNEQEFNYVKKHPEKYSKVTGIQSTKNLQPGDIFFKNGELDSGVGHTFIYVGNQTGGNMREASYHKRPPSASNILTWYTSQGDTTAYRLK